jgi:hypothetical protein
MAIDNTKKSGRLLQSRRYTHDTFTDAQEAFTSALDINATEIYIDQNLIPTSSLPFSGSGQNLSTFSGSLKYYYRQALTKSDLNNEVWFFVVPSGSVAGIGAQLITGNQQTNFISPKYAVSSLANANSEDTPPGYLAKVFVSTNPTTPANGDVISINNYAFDYKTGVLQFSSSAVTPTAGQYVYMSAYQYIGRTLSSLTTTTGVSTASFATTASYILPTGLPTGTVSSSQQINTGSFSGSFTGTLIGTSSWANNAISASFTPATFPFSGSAVITGSLTVTGSMNVTGSLNAQTGSIQTLTVDRLNVIGGSGVTAIGESLILNGSSINLNANLVTLGTALGATGIVFDQSNGFIDIKQPTNFTNPVIFYDMVTANTQFNVGGNLMLSSSGRVSAVSYTSSIANGVGYFGTASRAVSSSFATTASWARNALSSSFATTASWARNALSSSFAPPTFPFIGAASISGSLVVSDTVNVGGDLTLSNPAVGFNFRQTTGSVVDLPNFPYTELPFVALPYTPVAGAASLVASVLQDGAFINLTGTDARFKGALSFGGNTSFLEGYMRFTLLHHLYADHNAPCPTLGSEERTRCWDS